MEKDHTSDSEDLYDDIHSPSTSGGALKDGATTAVDEIWLDESTMPSSVQESELKKAEMKLYAELLVSDMNKRKENVQVASDYEELKKQVSFLKAEIADKDAKLAELTLTDDNLRKNICSLYRTAKAEIDNKNFLMTEINRELDSYKYPSIVAADHLQKQSPQSSNERPIDNCKVEPHGSRAIKRENPEERHTESSPHNKGHSDGHQRSLEQSSSKRKRSRSPPRGNKNCKTGANFYSNKGQRNNDSVYVKKKQSFDSSSLQNTTELLQTENLDNIQRPSAASAENTIHTPSNESSHNSPNCDLNRGHSSQVTDMDQEPSIAEVFSKMQELAFNDPVATNAIFFNMLPSDLRQSFTEFEKTQTDALNKLKQSFVSCYFAQCGVSSSSEVPTPEESTDGESKVQNSAAFFFQTNSSLSNLGNNTEGTVADKCSDIPNKSQESYSEGHETKIASGSKNAHTTVTENCSNSRSKPQDDCSEGNKRETESVSKNYNRTVAAECSDSLSKHRETYSDRNKTETVNVSKNCYRTIAERCSDSLSKPQENSIDGSKMGTASDVQKLRRKHVARHKLSKQVFPKLRKDESATLYAQRQLRRYQD